jgi:polygalacturonase
VISHAVSCVLLLAAARAQDTRHVTEPVVPPACKTLTAGLGLEDVESNESQLDTSRIQQGLDQCPSGHAVELKSDGARNAFLSGPLELPTGVTLLVDEGVTLFASRNPRFYDVSPDRCGTIDDRGHGCRALINGDHVHDAGVMGGGAIDGLGGAKISGQSITWWELADKARAGGTQNNPRLIILSHCDNFTLYRIRLKNSPNFHVSYAEGNGFTAWGVVIDAPKKARNTDGIDPANSTNVTIAHSFIRTGDDQVAIKAGRGAPTAHMTIAHNHFYTGHGMSIGSETDGGASAIRVQDLSIDGADNGIRIKSNSSRGGLVRDVVYEDVCIRATKNPILIDTHYTPLGKETGRIPVFQDIALVGVRILDGGKITLDGFDREHPLRMAFDGVFLHSPAAVQMAAAHADLAMRSGGTNIPLSGEDVHIEGPVQSHAGGSVPNSSAEKFVAFPEN